MLAFGAKCSVGDQAPSRRQARREHLRNHRRRLREVEACEPWCRDARQIFDLGVLSSEAENHVIRDSFADEGATRVLLESHFLFGFIDRDMDFSTYRALLLPDNIRIDAELKAKLDRYLAGGGKLILSGKAAASGLMGKFASISARSTPAQVNSRLIILCRSRSCAPISLIPTSHVPPLSAHPRHEGAEPRRHPRSLFQPQLPPFLQPSAHAYRTEPSGFAGGVRHGNILYFAHPVFSHYRAYGAVAYREFVSKAIRWFLGMRLLFPPICRPERGFP